MIPLGLGLGAGFLLPAQLRVSGTHRPTPALFLGVALGASPIPVAAKMLADMKLLHRDVGQLAAATVADFVGSVMLSLVAPPPVLTMSVLARCSWPAPDC